MGSELLFLLLQKPSEVLKSGPNFMVEVTYRKLPDGKNVTVQVDGRNSYEIEGVGENEKYEVVVRARNDEGLGPETRAVLQSSGGGKFI